MDSPAKILANWIIANGLGVAPPIPANTTLKWQTTYSKMPDDAPDARIACMDSGIQLDGRQQRTGEIIGHPLVQIRLRCGGIVGADYDEAMAKGKAIVAALALIKNTPVTVGSNNYTIKSATVYIGLTPMGQEEQNKRWNFSINVRLTF